ncbi:hypothetical protein L195_g057342, partial [Trifolium pratense]
MIFRNTWIDESTYELTSKSDDGHPLACGSSSTGTPYALSTLQMGRRSDMQCVR